MEPEEAETISQKAIGILCHNIMEAVGLYPTIEEATLAVEKAVQRTYNRGMIPDEQLRDEILLLTRDTVLGLSKWFTGDWIIQREQAVLFMNKDHDVEERRMDRVMWSPDRTKAIVLDYKFGKDDTQYDAQVRRYMDICRRMGAQSVEGYLWIAKEKNLIAL